MVSEYTVLSYILMSDLINTIGVVYYRKFFKTSKKLKSSFAFPISWVLLFLLFPRKDLICTQEDQDKKIIFKYPLLNTGPFLVEW
ncbi:hypothetical protein ES708_16854 [subsurface metagenome]